MILKSRKHIGAAGVKGDLGEWEQCNVRCLHIDAIGKSDKDVICGSNFVGTGSVGAKEMVCATGVRYGSGLNGGN